MNVLQFIIQNRTEVLELTAEHLWLVGASILLAVLIGIPLGILITRWPVLNKPVLGGANIIQTIPSLALFGFVLPGPWIGARGLGEYIFRGLAMVNNQVILAGAIPAAGLAILADVSLGWLEKRLSPH